ncbi:Nn.00g006060.m01.CDS01 [Neocucurbitaria sp. VM-36]
MHSFKVLLAFLFAFVATSHAFPTFGFVDLEVRKDRNGTRGNGGDTTKQACKQMQKLTKLMGLAANQTKLDELVAKGKMNTTEVDALKAMAADASTKLQTLESNSTLTTTCAVISAERQTKQECSQMKQLQKLATLASNQTAMDAFVAKKSLNSTQVDKLKERISNAETKLQTLSSNTTLTDLCATLKQGKGSDNSSTAAETSDGSSTPAQVSTSGASERRMTLASLSYALLPGLAGVFVMAL